MERLSPLIETERRRLAQMLGAADFHPVEPQAGHCSIAAGDLTVHFYRRPGSEIIHSSIELRAPPEHRVTLSDHVQTWMILRSRGEAWPEALHGGAASRGLADELGRLSRALEVVRDEDALLEALLWEAGYRGGYLAWG